MPTRVSNLETNKTDAEVKHTKTPKYILFISAFILIFIVLARPMLKKFINSSAGRTSDKSANYHSLNTRSGMTKLDHIKDSLIKKHLLNEINYSLNSSEDVLVTRNIFLSKIRPSPLLIKKTDNDGKPKEPQQIIPPLKLKLVGIIAQSDDKFSEKKVLLAILADEKGTYFVKKGDVLMDQYEIVNIEEEAVEIRDVQFNKTDRLKLIL
jgi:hypothetical protein